MTIELRQDVPLPEYIETDEQAQELLRFAIRKVETDVGDLIGWDTETHAKHIPIPKKPPDPITDTVTFWSLCFASDESGELQYRRWCLQQQHFMMFSPLLEHPQACFTAWNAKYDAHIAWNCNVNVWNATILDGMAMAHLHDENRREYSLKACARDWCGLHMTPYKALFDTDVHGNKAKEFETSLYDLDLGLVIDYASYDAYACLKTAEWLRDRLAATIIHPNGRTLWDHFCEFEIPFTRTLWRMERRGLPVDVAYLREQIPRAEKEIDELERVVNRTAGRPVNIKSPAQLSALFFNPANPEPPKDPKAKPVLPGFELKPLKMTKGGSRLPQPSTDEEVLNLLGEVDGAPGAIARDILRCRKLHKIKGTYMESFVAMAEYFPDGRVHPNFNQFGARTGRQSTSNPNSQNWPRPDNDEFGIRRSLTAPPGKKLIVADWEQLEMRIMADRSQDPKMIQAILEGKDLHSFTAGEMEDGITYEEVAAAKKAESPDDRQKWLKGLRQGMKAVGFGIIYGAGPAKIAENITINEEEAWKIVETMDESDLESLVAKKLRDNPVLSVDQARRLVGEAEIAKGKIEAYFQVFPRVKAFMDGTPSNCKYHLTFDLLGNHQYRQPKSDPDTPYNWDVVPGDGFLSLTRTGHVKPFGFVQTYLGRYRRLEDIDHQKYQFRGHAEREATNTVIQGTAADLAKGAMLRVESNRDLNLMGVELLNQVHDELVLEAPEEHAEEALAIVEECMLHPFVEGEGPLCVPIPTNGVICDNWSEAK
jgi:DNA polymerase I-like protein with 3'-5' exonuclease and polymerase domains